jgi:hypothetical protein
MGCQLFERTGEWAQGTLPAKNDGNLHGRPRNHVSVRFPFTDERGEGILREEAKQLPKDGPGLIMINVANNPGNFDAWASFIAPRFRRDIHTRVSAVCLFSEGIGDAGKRYSYFIEGRLLLNDQARYRLPAWIGGDSRITFVTAISPRSVALIEPSKNPRPALLGRERAAFETT